MPNETLTDKHRLHLETIQKIIDRVSNNTFLLRGWCVSLLAAILAGAVALQIPALSLLGVFCSLIFYFLDSFYQMADLRFRAIFVESFNSDQPQAYTFDHRSQRAITYGKALLYHTTFPFYLTLVLLCILAYAFMPPKHDEPNKLPSPQYIPVKVRT